MSAGAEADIYSIVGFTISGALWTQTMYNRLLQYVEDPAVAQAMYGDPYTAAAQYPVGTPERTGMIRAYQSVQRLLCITGLALVRNHLFVVYNLES